MKQLTLSLDDETFDSADSKARRAGISLTALVTNLLRQFSNSPESEFERLEKQEEALRQTLRARGAAFSAEDRLSRDELHERHAFR